MNLIDTNILSTFAKINRLDILFEVLGDDTLHISPNVLTELRFALDRGYEFCNEIFRLVDKKKIHVVSLTHEEHVLALKLPRIFGKGELDSLALCLSRKWKMVTNERKVVNFCKEHN